MLKWFFFATPICAIGIASFILFTFYKINIRVTISLHFSLFYFVKRCSAKVLSMWIPLDRSILNIIIEKTHPYKNEIIYVRPLLVMDDCYIKSNNHLTGFIKKRGKIYWNTVCRKDLSFHNTIHFQNDFVRLSFLVEPCLKMSFADMSLTLTLSGSQHLKPSKRVKSLTTSPYETTTTTKNPYQ